MTTISPQPLPNISWNNQSLSKVSVNNPMKKCLPNMSCEMTNTVVPFYKGSTNMYLQRKGKKCYKKLNGKGGWKKEHDVNIFLQETSANLKLSIKISKKCVSVRFFPFLREQRPLLSNYTKTKLRKKDCDLIYLKICFCDCVDGFPREKSSFFQECY